MTAKCQLLQCSLYQIEEGDTFGDEMDEDEMSDVGPQSSVSDREDSDDDIRADDEDNINTQTEVVEKAKKLIVPEYAKEFRNQGYHADVGYQVKKANPNPKSRLNVS